jgi:hypothetical protein
MSCGESKRLALPVNPVAWRAPHPACGLDASADEWRAAEQTLRRHPFGALQRDGRAPAKT